MCNSIVDYYIARPDAIKHACGAKFVSMCNKKGTPITKRKKPKVIQFIKYKKHADYENYCREKILLYAPFEKMRRH